MRSAVAFRRLNRLRPACPFADHLKNRFALECMHKTGAHDRMIIHQSDPDDFLTRLIR